MDISGIDFNYKVNPQSSAKIKKDSGFSQIFDTKLAETKAVSAGNKVQTSGIHDGNFDVLEHGNKILNLLDDYASQLENPDRTLKHIGPLVQTIEKETSLMETNISDKVQDDKELEKFVKDLTVTANVAAFKFYRGDYV